MAAPTDGESNVSNDSNEPRRRSTRQPIIALVWYEVIDSDPVANGVARSCNVSPDGLGLVTDDPLPVGGRLFVEIATKAGGLSLVGTVVHSAKRQKEFYQSGIRIDVVPPNDRALLERLLDR